MGIFNLDIGISKIIDTVAEFIPNSNQRDKMQHDLKILIQEQAQQLALEQIKTNQIEAGHKSVFVAGWRPFVGWVCGVGVLWAFVLQPFLSWVSVVVFGYSGTLPLPDIANLLVLLGGLLGMGTLRTVEKSKGVAR